MKFKSRGRKSDVSKCEILAEKYEYTDAKGYVLIICAKGDDIVIFCTVMMD